LTNLTSQNRPRQLKFLIRNCFRPHSPLNPRSRVECWQHPCIRFPEF
jgi:hypothetical protein